MSRPVEELLVVPSRTVKPRTRTFKQLPIMAIAGDDTLDEQGVLSTVPSLVGDLPTMPSTLFATVGAADFVAQLDATYSKLMAATWQWRVSTLERDIVRPDGVRIAARVSVVVHYFGWKNGNFHKIIDPVVMYGHKLDTIWPRQGDQLSTLSRLMGWTTTIRDFCGENGIEVRPTSGGISSQLLTDRRFYPRPRRKVPQFVNEQVRSHQPGNYYHLNVVPEDRREFRAHYLDQSAAHHYHAATLALPDADLLYAHGRYLDLDKLAFPAVWPNFYGLYCLDLHWERGAGTRAYQWLGPLRHDLDKQFVWSNELPHLADMGFTVTGVRAAWGSRKRDTGLPKYAAWCQTQLERYDNAPWIKPLLLSAYGALATRPRCAEAVFRMASKGEPAKVHTGRLSLTGIHTKGTKKLEPGICNVLHRGMIEAATRSESVGLAQWLASTGHQILSIYADAVIVRDDEDRPLPSLPPPWRLKRTLNHLQFINQQAFISGEMTKLPGVTRELRDHTRRVHAPRLNGDSVEELMENEETINALITYRRTNHEHGKPRRKRTP